MAAPPSSWQHLCLIHRQRPRGRFVHHPTSLEGGLFITHTGPKIRGDNARAVNTKYGWDSDRPPLAAHGIYRPLCLYIAAGISSDSQGLTRRGDTSRALSPPPLLHPASCSDPPSPCLTARRNPRGPRHVFTTSMTLTQRDAAHDLASLCLMTPLGG